MGPFGALRRDSTLQGYVGLALVIGVGLSTGILAVNHAIQTEFGAAGAVYIGTPILVSFALIVSGISLWVQHFDGPEMLRVGGWMFVGMVVFGLLITWTITHEAIRGETVSHGFFLTLNSVTIGGFVGLILGSLDAHNRLYEKQLEREQQKLESQIAQLDEFASIVSHDLRNPLNVASLHLETIKNEHESVATEKVDTSLSRMERIIEDVLTMAKEGQAVEETETVSLNRIAERSWQNVDTRAGSLQLDSDMTIQADRSQLQHVFENLFRNSIEHGLPDSDEKPQAGEQFLEQQSSLIVRVGALPNGFYVEDTGVGIPEAAEDSLFEAGFTTNRDGTGFGLRIVEKMVSAHGWKISVAESDEGGARFEITGVDTHSHPGR